MGAWFVLSGWSTLPNLILVLCLSLSIGMPLLKSLGFLPTMPQLNYKISALEQVLDAPELQQTEDVFNGKDDTITYDHVSFGYQTTQPGPDGKPVVTMNEVLHDISFTAKAGQKTALVGESGSGKSTLAKLLIHYYDPQKGSISIGGQKLCDMSLEALNSRISYVAQDQYLFNTSLLENIRIGRLKAPQGSQGRDRQEGQAGCGDFGHHPVSWSEAQGSVRRSAPAYFFGAGNLKGCSYCGA